MQDTQLFNEGFALMGLGMGFVFVFLTVLVIVTTLMSRFIGRFFPEPSADATAATPRPAPAAQDDALMAVIGAAIHRYRRDRRR
ncbi:OadG family protein [Halomonas organivorans]|uniref:Probable oxaloacetate decarboxylase gamma chain n=1 Tax=Halomonas organivorans TaxID=257772 RepID=A0A7W5BZG2_9GAMM|nr:OadG family transporter subunit [Halomonas organivorans]MBB3141987.1 oxaloacetate decarboxylase gamma subunit [Halomonas organivorans]